MPVYHRHRLVHIHIPKTGGTAIEGYFHRIGDMEWGPASWLGRQRHQGRWYELQHLTWQELAELSGLDLDTYGSFAVVRDPYARLLSDYLWRRRLTERRPAAMARFSGSFRDFVMAIPPDLNARWIEYIDGVGREEANFLIHVRPQTHFVFDGQGTCQVDEVLRFEDLDREFARLLAGYGLAIDVIRRPRQRDVQAFYDREMLDRLNELYRTDFDLLGYELV